MSKKTFKTAYRILFLLDSISIATYVICVTCDVCSEQRKLIGVLLPWLVIWWVFLFNKAFGGIGAIIRDIAGRDFY